MFSRFCAFVLLHMALSFCTSLAHAENRALLIGASSYPANIGPLRGPVNDVQAIWGLLTERGFKGANIRVLADGLPDRVMSGAKPPRGLRR